MPADILWGESKLAGALQELLTVLGAPILTVDDTPIDTVYPELTFEPLLTVAGDPILTVTQSPIIAIVGAAAPPLFWQTADVSSDGGVSFGFTYENDPWQPSAQGGENVFAWLFVTLSWSMAATVRVSARVDGGRAAVALPDGSTLEFVDFTFVLPQQGGSLQRRSGVFPVPLVRKQVRNDVEVSRWNLRGERLSVIIESTGPLGVGELMLDGLEVEYEAIRKAIYEEVTS